MFWFTIEVFLTVVLALVCYHWGYVTGREDESKKPQ